MQAWKRLLSLTLTWLIATAPTIAIAAGGIDRNTHDTTVIGSGTATTKKVQFDIGNGAANPAIQSTSAGVLQFANDGVNFTTFGTGSGGGSGINLLKNDGFELGTANWTVSGATFTTTSTAANVGFDLAAGAFTASATSQTLTSDQVTVPAGLYGQVCSARIWYKGGSANLALKVIDGSSSVLATRTLAAQTNYVQSTDLRFACPTSGTYALQIASTGSSAIAYLDKAFLGSAPRTVNESTVENLVPNGNAEDQLNPTVWTVYDDSAAAAPVDGTGGTPANITAASITTTSGDVISGSRSYLLAKSAANAQGQGWSVPITVPAHSPYQNAFNDLAFDYYMDTTTADMVRVYLYDVTNSTLITPQFVTCGGGSTPSLASTTSTCHAELGWLASGTGTSYRLIFHVAGTSTSAVNVWVDNLFVGQHRLTVGTQSTYLGNLAFTPVNFGTVTSSRFDAWRIANVMRVHGYWVNGTVVASAASLTLPSGYTIDSSDLSSAASGTQVGTFVGTTSASTALYAGDTGIVFYDGSTTGSLYFATNATSAVYNKNNGSSLTQTSQAVDIWFEIPISQWAGGSAFGENKVEYLSAVGTWGTSASQTLVSSPGGSLGGTTTPSGTGFSYTLTPLSPIYAGTTLQMEFSSDGTHWSPTLSGLVIDRFHYDGTNYIGADATAETNGTVKAQFGKYATGGSTVWTGTWYWRIKKTSPGMVTAFGLASTTGPGLVSTTAQTLAGVKTFQDAVSISETTGGTGNVPHACSIRSNTCAAASSCVLTCSAGERVFGGGCSWSGGTQNLTESYPSSSSAWTCHYASAPGTSMTTWGQCCTY